MAACRAFFGRLNNMKPRYKTNLTDLHTSCETNYLRLQMLINHDESQELFLLEEGGNRVRIDINIEPCSRFTDTVTLTRMTEISSWLPSFCITVRVYHDAKMAEVIESQGYRVPLFRPYYPNRLLMQEDEKYQANVFLGECLLQCLQLGQSVDSISLID